MNLGILKLKNTIILITANDHVNYRLKGFMYTRRTLELFGLMIIGVGHALLKHYIGIDIKSPALAFMRQTTGLKVFDEL